MALMTPHPTVVIGAGQAGVNVLSTIEAVVQEHDDQEFFHYIAVDSDQAVLRHAPSDAACLFLSTDGDLLPLDRKTHPYLTTEMSVPQIGAARQRPVGRYKLDNSAPPGFDDTLATLEDEIRQHFEAHAADSDPDGPTSFTIILVAALGGGTGSGTYPLLLAMLNEVTSEFEDVDSLTYIAGVGIVSEMPNAHAGVVSELSPGVGQYYPNTYAALKDLETLIDIQRGDPLDVPVYATGDSSGQSEPNRTFELTEVPFDDYWFVSVDEERMSDVAGTDRHESYPKSRNQTIARAIHALSNLSAQLPTWSMPSPLTGTFEQTEVAVPHQAVREFVERQSELSRLQQRLDDELSTQLERIDARKAELEDRKYSFEIDDPALRESVREIIADELPDDDQFLDAVTATEIDDVLDRIDDSHGLEGVIVATNDLTQRLEAADDVNAVGEEFEAVVAKLWSKYDLQSHPGYTGERTVDRAAVLREFFSDQIDTYRNIVADWDPTAVERLQDAIPPLSSAFESDRERAERVLDTLQADYDEFKTIEKAWTTATEIRQTLANRRSDVRRRLDDRIADCDRRMTEILDERQRLETECESLERTIHNQRAALTDATTGDRRTVLPLDGDRLDDLDIETVETELTSLSDYVDQGLVAEETLQRALTRTIDRCKAWDARIMNRDFADGDTPPVGDDNELWLRFDEANSALITPTNMQVWPATVRTSVQGVAYLDDPYRIECVSYTRRGPLSALEYYQRLEEMAADGRLDQMATQYEDYRQAFAYCEWYSRAITDIQSEATVVTLEDPPEMDPAHLDTSDLAENDVEDYVKASGLEAYLWKGGMLDRYDAPDTRRFRGWREELSNHGISFTDLQQAAPSPELKARWLADDADWRDILTAYEETLGEHTGLAIEIDNHTG